MGYRGRWAVCRRNAGVDDRNLNNSALSHRSELCVPGMSNSLFVGVDPICLLPGLWAPVSRGLGLAAPCQGGDASGIYLHLGTSCPSSRGARSIVESSTGRGSVGKEVRPVGRGRFPRNGAGSRDERVSARGGFDDELAVEILR